MIDVALGALIGRGGAEQLQVRDDVTYDDVTYVINSGYISLSVTNSTVITSDTGRR